MDISKYRNGKIYMITTENSNDIYIGSTILTLTKRLQIHESEYRTGKYCSSQEILKHGNYKILLVKKFACNSLFELETEETKIQKSLICVNKHLARLTDDEKRQNQRKYRIENKESKKQYNNKYRIENKDRLTKKINCVCGSHFQRCHKSQHYKSIKHINFLKSKTKYIFKIKR